MSKFFWKMMIDNIMVCGERWLVELVSYEVSPELRLHGLANRPMNVGMNKSQLGNVLPVIDENGVTSIVAERLHLTTATLFCFVSNGYPANIILTIFVWC